MKQNKFIDIIGTLILFAGAVMAFLPHAFHSSIGLEDDSHIKHVITGFILILLGLGILVYNNDALKFQK
ncbi:hypothetical protein HYV80_03010 [Candidatus Woesearchaeota archaeon]|nr:hypothetical protein [Candidatus Woesearchaeota archaeon]